VNQPQPLVEILPATSVVSFNVTQPHWVLWSGPSKRQPSLIATQYRSGKFISRTWIGVFSHNRCNK